MTPASGRAGPRPGRGSGGPCTPGTVPSGARPGSGRSAGSRIGLERRSPGAPTPSSRSGRGRPRRALRLGLAGPERIRICRPVVELGEEPGQGRWARARRRLDLPLGVRVVGAVGRLTRQKGPDVFVRALALLPGDVHGLWVGDGPLGDRLARLTRRLGLADRVRWLGHRDDVAELLPGFDVLAVPSRWAGLPVALLEGVAAGIPVVASAVSSLDEVVLPRETGLLVAPGDPAELAKALAWMLDRPEIAREMALNARNLVGSQERYSLPRLGAVLAATYRDTGT